MVYENKHKGSVVFWNGMFGFIEDENGNTLFFRKKNILADDLKNKINYSYQVSYTIGISTDNKHLGKPFADNIELIEGIDIWEVEKSKLINEKLFIGKVESWEPGKKNGYLESPQIDGRIQFFQSRLLKREHNINKDDLMVFYPVRCIRRLTEKFTFFAYPLYLEKDPVFLLQQLRDSGQVSIKEHLKALLSRAEDALPIDTRFYIELSLIDFSKSSFPYSIIESLIVRYKKQNYTPPTPLLMSVCPAVYVIQLWENEIINNLDYYLLERYFLNGSSDIKRSVALRLYDSDREKILNSYFSHLKRNRRLERVSNDVKTLLDISNRIEKTRNEVVYQSILAYLNTRLKPKELIDLWKNGYITGLPEQFLKTHFDLNIADNLFSSQKLLDEKEKELFLKLYEDYFLDFSSIDFETAYPDLIIRLKIFEKHYKSRYKAISDVIKVKLSNHQLFILWIFETNIAFDAMSYFIMHHEKLESFYIIKFLLHEQNKSLSASFLSNYPSAQISNDSLLSFIKTNPWNKILTPTKSAGKYDYNSSFLGDVKSFQARFNNIDLNLTILAECIFETIKKYSVWHIRLWLYGYVDKTLFDYVGFRDNFKDLNKNEQSLFKELGDRYGQQFEVLDVEVQEVLPCKDYDYINSLKTKYNAFLENIYFGNGKFKLRTEDGLYTEWLEFEYVSPGMNRIPLNHRLNKMAIVLEVSKISNTLVIDSQIGLELIIQEIHRDSIERVLGIVKSTEPQDKNSNKAYVEDWNLRREIVAWLNQIQCIKKEIKYINEPKKPFGRLDKEAKNLDYEKCALYSIKTDDGYAIVWENIDLSFDRATYVFKCTNEKYSAQLSQISEGVTSYAQFRSTLFRKPEEPGFEIVRKKFGYVANIRKKRGNVNSLLDYKRKLEFIIKQPIPPEPSDDELKTFEEMDWFVVHHPHPQKEGTPTANTIKTIKNEQIDIADPAMGGKVITKTDHKSVGNITEKSAAENTLELLRTFNQKFLENFNI